MDERVPVTHADISSPLVSSFSTDQRVKQQWQSTSPTKQPQILTQGRQLLSPADSDQEQNDLEVASVLSRGNWYNSTTKSYAGGSVHKAGVSPSRPSTVITNIQRGNITTHTPSLPQSITLHQMAAQGELTALKQALSQGADINLQDDQGLTPLMWACSNGQLAVVNCLLAKGADVTRYGNQQENALLMSCTNGYALIAKVLLKMGKADVNYVDESGASGLMYAAYGNHTACVGILLEYGADVTVENEDGHSALDIAATKGYKTVQQMIEKYLLQLLTGEVT